MPRWRSRNGPAVQRKFGIDECLDHLVSRARRSESSCPPGQGVRQSQDAMGQHGAHVREVEPLLALAVGKLDLVLRQVRARPDGQAGKPTVTR
jgi:hypothetical protein